MFYFNCDSDCGQNVTVPNGFVNALGVATTFHEKLPVSCNEGYDLEGDPEIICQANGDWSDESYCVEKGTAIKNTFQI